MEYSKLIIVAILASMLTLSIGFIISVFKRFLSQIKIQATKLSKPKLSTNKNVDLRIKSLEDEVRELRKYIRTREVDRKSKVKKIVIDYLTELRDGK